MQTNKLYLGDIILTEPKSFNLVGKIIQEVTGSKYSHAAMYIGNDNIIEAIAKGVVINNINKYKKYDVFRAEQATPYQRYYAVEYAKSNLFKKYDFLGILGILKSTIAKKEVNKWDVKERLWCSELIADSYIHAGVDIGICDNTYLVSPGDLSQIFKQVR
jgi:uncharacterized protein YycO